MREKNEPLNATLFIIALTFLALLVSACSNEKQSTTTIMANINGYSFDNNRQLQQFQTFVFDNGRVLATGDSTIEDNYPDANVIDGEGLTLLPG
ncbi:MAG: hypothetical protein HN552_00210, partial [Porticoccaceae bacterium]|nr:hypothetical protein [Porticoccaceae bacterium]